jgi:hypothetical protein
VKELGVFHFLRTNVLERACEGAGGVPFLENKCPVDEL